MHEMSVAEALLEIIREEMRRHGVSRLLSVKVSCGVLSQVVPEALDLAFAIMIKDTELEGACLHIIRQELVLACGACGCRFSPEPGPLALVASCPSCSRETGHLPLRGRELLLEDMEVE